MTDEIEKFHTTLSTDTRLNWDWTAMPAPLMIELEPVYPWRALEWIMVHLLGDVCCRNVPIIRHHLFWIVQRSHRVKRV